MTVLRPPGEFEALGFDPAPGELGRVTQVAGTYQRVSRQLGVARDALESIINQTGTWEGEASEAFARRVGDLPEYLGKATDSMTKASGALNRWSDALGDMQNRARDLERRARQARKEAEQARDNPAFGLANQTFHDQESLQAAQRALDQAAQQLTSATDKLEAILAEAERLLQQHTELAERIAELLRQAREIAPDEPGLFGKALEDLADFATEVFNDVADTVTDIVQGIGDFVEDNAQLIANVSDVLGDVSTMIGAVGDVLNVIPVVGQVADQALNTVSGALGGLAFAGHLTARAAGGEEVVADETIALDATGLATNWIPGGGLGMLAGQGLGEAATGGEAGTIYDNFGKYWAPHDLRQGVQMAVNPVSVAFENAIVDGVEKDNAGQVERDRERAEERVWQ